VLDALDARGLFLSGGETDGYQLNPLIRDFALTRMPLPQPEREAITERAGRWYADAGAYAEALSCLTGLDDAGPVAALLRESGHLMIARGDAEAVVAAIGKIPDALRDDVIDQYEGEARQMLGDWEGAQVCFARIIPPTGPIPVGLARRAGLIYHLRGHIDEAIDMYSRGALDGSDDREEALLQAWWAAAHWLRADVEECRKRGAIALAKARAVDDDRALAAAHTVLGMLAGFDSDPRAHAAHYLHALDHAERAGDVLQSIRIRTNRGSHHTSESNYTRAIAELDVAIQLADLAGFAAFRALALSNRGEALLGLGRLDEAIKELEASRALYQRLESRLVSQPLAILGEVYRERGDLAMARACYEEAISIANEIGDVQSLVPALAGLARVLVEEEPERSADLADLARRAVAYGPVLGHSAALLSLGWVTLFRGDRDTAIETAEEAAAVCGRRRDRAGLASALELKAAAVGPSGASVGGPAEQVLLEALSIRREIGDPLGEARIELMLAEHAAGTASARELAESAHRRFLACGATRHAATAQLVAERSGPPAVEVESLGGFRVLRDGRAVALSEWPSRKARDLLKILVARRCHPVPRSQLLDLLWPGEDESAVSPRLSVALSTVRAVLDPEKRYPADRFIGGDRTTVWLDASVLAVDVEAFLRDAHAGLDALAAGRIGQSVLLLRAAEAAYAGDFLEEDVYQDWAAGLRDEARALYIRVARALAERAGAVGEHDAAAGYLLRILQRDPYDERAHLALVSSYVGSGAHGEARRAYRTYVSRLGELGVEPAPFPGEATRRTG
jgi:DNA-binding SARP family transcriptional activator/tetratricopeptide (TPR) repeat protein